ncbi:hypothetical protein F1C16_22355 (plasmid) [Hymenobacter sp. NBH84]|uniref:hypothetical protein n=1 Tax=Hymenobacter sp. NBH84 TaxID=2596915 RepID=UPI001624B148|nr:hypothetical protein [Hymenobacter sp. NBH84]QNE42365.1 hypothetical protein F1C16_22355 [Hymenobacter sp. NBH84]
MKISAVGLLTILVLLATVQQGWAQEVRNTSLNAEQQLLEQLVTERSVFQRAAAPTSLLNVTQLTQQGAGNAAHIVQVGSSNVTLISQVGVDNVVNSTISGQHTRSEIVQQGARNVVDQQLTVDGRRYAVLQQGLDNQLKQVESGAQAPPGYQVQMVGNGMKISIQQGQAAYRP